MNSLILSIQSATPPKRKRQSLPLIASRSKVHHNSLHISRNINPPELSINGPHSQRLMNEKPKENDKEKGSEDEIDTDFNLPLTSRRSEDKYLHKRQRTDNSNLFLVRNKNNNYKKRVFLKSLAEDETIRPKREFDEYLTYIKSQSDKYILPKYSKKQTENTQQIIKTIKHIFWKVSQSLESNPKTSKQLCITYLSFYQKILFEASVSIGLSQSILNKLFIIQRLISYYIVILFASNKFDSYVPLFIKATYYFYTFFQSLSSIKKKHSKSEIGSTVKSTQLVCEVEKGCNQILSDLKLLTKPLSRQLYEADKQLLLLLHFTNQPNFTQRLMKLQFSLNWKLFKLPPIPYLPCSDREYTILLQLDMTITYYDETNKLLMFRPYLQQLLDVITEKYEVVLWTVAIKQYADKIVEEIDPLNHIFKARLYNQHISICGGEYLKDLSRLGRNMSKIIIIDSEQRNYRGYEENGIKINKWFGSQFDDALKSVSNMLEQLTDKGTKDIKKKIKQNKPLLTHISEEPEETLISNK